MKSAESKLERNSSCQSAAARDRVVRVQLEETESKSGPHKSADKDRCQTQQLQEDSQMTQNQQAQIGTLNIELDHKKNYVVEKN